MSDRQNVVTPVGSVAPQPARSRSTSSPGRRRASRRVRRQPEADRGFSSCSARAGSIPSQVGSTPRGGSPVSSAKAVAASP